MHQMSTNEEHETVALKASHAHVEEGTQDGESQSHSAPAISSSSHLSSKRKALSSSSSLSLDAAAAGALAPIEELEEEEENESSPTTRSPPQKRVRLENEPGRSDPETALASARPRRWSDLPRDCLEAITQFLNLKEFTVASRVCREWSQTCEEVPSRSDTLVLTTVHLTSALTSPLRRHISKLDIRGIYPHRVQSLTPESLICLADRMPHLTSLTGVIESRLRDADLVHVFPPQLRELDIKLCVYVPERESCSKCHGDIVCETDDEMAHEDQDEGEDDEDDEDEEREEYTDMREFNAFRVFRRSIHAVSLLPLVCLRVRVDCGDNIIWNTGLTSTFFLTSLKPLSATRDTLTKLEVIWPLRKAGIYATDVAKVAFLQLHRLVDLKLQFGRDPALPPIVYHRSLPGRTGHSCFG